ncbi:uncharacterized protein EDB93DRAFT_1100225 [Suillus bovinus]|uniref:uncharacterized protein n=1 Tax=Suillus bovinus TaxID=48563 RepID=UPI001B8745DE|nr:uncharacterized protein EDB93DRAFT_1100225 [Suillus bovinus]KAG2158547.1 hypothetical protein EDB93DRAFT_1100225 [Suillus bovinus]
MCNTDLQFMAHSMLGSVLQMDSVSTMLQRGMDKIRDMMVWFSKNLNWTKDFSKLEEADVKLPLNWSLTAKSALTVADLTAHECHESWHDVQFKGAKCTKQNRDPTYCPSELDDGSSELATPATRTRSWAHRTCLLKCMSTFLPPPHKSMKMKKAQNTAIDSINYYYIVVVVLYITACNKLLEFGSNLKGLTWDKYGTCFVHICLLGVPGRNKAALSDLTDKSHPPTMLRHSTAQEFFTTIVTFEGCHIAKCCDVAAQLL